MLHSNYNSSFGMSRFHMADSICNSAQRETLIDTTCHLARINYLFHQVQMLLVRSRQPHYCGNSSTALTAALTAPGSNVSAICPMLGNSVTGHD